MNVVRQPSQGMSVFAVNDIRKGEQVFNFYTEDGDDDIFVGYGFCSKPGSFKSKDKNQGLFSGENEKSVIFISLAEVESIFASRLHFITDIEQVASTFDLCHDVRGEPGFYLYENGIDQNLQG